MKCPFCKNDNDRVIETRTSDDGFTIRRRRACHCGRRFTTYERIEVVNVRVVKRDGSRVPFDRNKVRRGVERACWKRSISESQISELVAALETSLEGETEVSTQTIGKMTMDLLKRLDDVAYVRFASVYYRFESVDDFATALKRMINEKTNERQRNG
ncbi:MAG: transcriptional regulator NrdR [Planctomycetia bacterium]|nr:transcriptional regulator NrdR [Planctomycetia bacterium]